MGVNTVKRVHKSGRVTWHVRWYKSQLEPVVHLGRFDTEAEAILRRDAARTMIAAHEFPTLDKLEFKGGGKFKELAELWLESRRLAVGEKTRLNDLTEARKCVAKFGPRDPRSITSREIQQWITDLYDTGFAVGTIKNVVKKGLAQIMAFGVVEGWLTENPVLVTTLPHRGKRKVAKLPTYAEWLSVREALDAGQNGGRKGDAVLAFDMITYGGFRVSEVMDCTWREVGDGRIVAGGKNETPLRNVTRLPYQPDWIPVMPKGANLDDPVCGPLSDTTFRYQLGKACEKAGFMRYDERKDKLMPGIWPHLMRKLCASLMQSKLAIPVEHGGHGLDTVSMATRMGHTQDEFLRTYSTLIPPADWR